MTGPVRRRHVFFLGGFDPKGGSYYHRLYRSQAALQAQVTGLACGVGARTKLANGNSQWTVQRGAESGRAEDATHTVFEYAQWDDIVRSHWPRSSWQATRDALALYGALALRPQLLYQGLRRAPNALLVLVFPLLFWMLVAALAGLAAVAAVLVAVLVLGQGLALGGVVAGLVGAAVGWAGWRWGQPRRIFWLAHIGSFVQRWARADSMATKQELGAPFALTARLAQLAQSVQARLDDPQVDEVLVVGFSVGSMLALAACGQVVARYAPGAAASTALGKLSLLTLGHCIPLLGFLMPQAQAFRADLLRVGQQTELCWVDISALADWGACAQVDPVQLCAPEACAYPNPYAMLSPRFHVLFAPAVYAQLRRDRRRMHLQYLMAGQLPGAYDYFALTAGGQRLRQRVPAMEAL